MQKAILGALVLAGVLLAGMWWRLESVTATAATQAAELKTAADKIDAMTARFEAVDQALTGWQKQVQANNADLKKRLDSINGKIPKLEGDSDESIQCLDVRVPRALDERMR